MRKKYLPLFILFFFLSSFAFAQEKICGLEHPEKFGIQMDEATKRRVQEIEDFTQNWISNQTHQAQTRSIITIPVVVHIVWNGEEENISDFEIEAQIDGLTADFRKLNNNSALVPEMFQHLAADTEIEFCIASLDPEGNVKKGIVRRQTNIENIATPYNGSNRICYDNLGGSDAWDPNNYVNIWVGQMEVFAGRATNPGTASVPAEDGIWIDPSFFGFFCSTINNLNLGRTLTHEMGHYLNLYHTWGEGGCNSTDFVDDTPVQADQYLNCPSFPQESCGSIDMFMNFMNYVDDDCMNLFTHGQKERMLAALANPDARAGLTTSSGCGWTTPKNLTLSPDNILLFPNPTKDCVHIDLNLDNDLPVRMGIFNSVGQAIYSSHVFAKDLRTLDVSHLSNGIYFVFFEANNQVATKKLIIDK